MSIEIKVPVLPESVADASIATWHKKVGERIRKDDHLLDVETDKVILEVVAPQDGFLESILKQQGESVKAQEVVGIFKEEKSEETTGAPIAVATTKEQKSKKLDFSGSPSERRLAGQQSTRTIQVSNPFTGETMVMHTKKNKSPLLDNPTSKAPDVSIDLGGFTGERVEKRVPMSRLRARIAERLVQAQQTAAILTTFNEINMHPVMSLRQKYKETFEKDYGVRLGFMSFFTIAVVEALKRFPIINASLDGQDIIYHGYHDIGIAVSSPRGLVVPVLRNAELLHMAQIEQKIAEFGQKAKNGQLSIEEITGGTFTITNGGVFGSLMATPILNPPQSGILGMHKIEERPVAENGQVVIRPMMYVALSYDHRIIDGAESVRFLVTVKELLEDPARLLLNV